MLFDVLFCVAVSCPTTKLLIVELDVTYAYELTNTELVDIFILTQIKCRFIKMMKKKLQ